MSVLPAFEANRIATKKSKIINELENLEININAATELGYFAFNVSEIQEANVDILQKLGYKCWRDETSNTWTVSWQEPEKASISFQNAPSEGEPIMGEYNIKIKNTEGSLLWEWSQEKKQQEAWMKNEKQKAKYESLKMAERIHNDNYRTPDAAKRYEEVLATANKIYEWLIKGGHIDLDEIEPPKE